MIDIFKNKVVLITGGTGSFGKKFVEFLIERHNPKKLIIFSRDEMKQYEMSKMFRDERLRFFIGDIRDADRLHRAFNGVNIIVHAAALKIVPTAEYNPFEAVKTNVIGSENIINLAIDNKVEKVIALSTDKAANPINLYGATKLCAEKMFIAANNYSAGITKFSVVRYGNVFGSRGSVVPFFKQCISTGVVPITDERMTRFWITLDEGVKFVINSLREMSGGEIFIPKLSSMKISDLARAICPSARHKIIGIRPGEKLHETLVPEDDGIYTYEYDDKFITFPFFSEEYNNLKANGKELGVDFCGYKSNTNTQWISVEELKNIAELE
ncbi:UDP-N-acetylglucosamine 4,6-dehydratase [Candidatus Omnitrophus magneticus]|uniref:UDP-N-acetylglucosamine 4,6-dehydratase n=1 Tax=Candidatus Omnitrophus magneticus TaxID=1609969 RepID=A0A0F0CRW8_9BACT|nr:UDP-N-acetylglucosamine 4,6-dehydratase [Candidatus Omnitrophus magneticus]